jgi:hypothetical protein
LVDEVPLVLPLVPSVDELPGALLGAVLDGAPGLGDVALPDGPGPLELRVEGVELPLDPLL